MTYDVVVPTVGRPSLARTLAGLAAGDGPLPERVIVVDDRRDAAEPLNVDVAPLWRERTIVIRGGGRGPAAARNAGARAGTAEWIAFLDDDVVPPAGWRLALERDIRAADDAAATQGRVMAAGADPHQIVKGLETAVWITADMAFRRDAFEAIGGFDERFRRAYREDSDLGLRLTAAGERIVTGDRHVSHPVPPSSPWAAVGRQRGNADDALMLFLHGPGWSVRAHAPRGDRRQHILTTALFAGSMLALATGRPRSGGAMFGAWLARTRRLAQRRGDVASSVAIPFAATWWWLYGLVRAWKLTRRPRAVLFDRDGTLVEDVPYNGDPRLVRPRPGARAALSRLRRAGIQVGMVTNQSGVGRGLVSHEQVLAVNARVEELLGPLDVTVVCTHAPDEGCACRKPQPGLVLEAARRLGVRPAECAVVGDIESDMQAALNAGARGVLVPNAVTRPDEVVRAKEVATTLEQAVSLLIGPGR